MAKKFDYHEYMGSRAWRLKRRENIEVWGNQCRRCASGPVENMHHLHYRTLGHEDAVSDLIGLCRACHEYLSAERDDDPAVVVMQSLITKNGMTPFYGGADSLLWHDAGFIDEDADESKFLALDLVVEGSERDHDFPSWCPRVPVVDGIVGIGFWI